MKQAPIIQIVLSSQSRRSNELVECRKPPLSNQWLDKLLSVIDNNWGFFVLLFMTLLQSTIFV